jgi:hypothetical protein
MLTEALPPSPSPSATRRAAVGLLCGALAHAAVPDTESNAKELRMSFSENGLFDLNPTDAKVALSLWTKRLGDRIGVKIIVPPEVFESTEQIIDRLQRKTVDAVAINMVEYLMAAHLLDPSRYLIEGELADHQYVLLARKDGPFRKASDLQGRSLIIWRQLKMTMARSWFTTAVYQGQKPPYPPFRVAIHEEPKAIRTVLPVFFGKADGCITTRSTYDGIVELNPQVGKALTVIETSPPVITSVYMFRRGFPLGLRDHFVDIVSRIGGDPGFQQVVTMFKGASIKSVDPSSMKETLAILNAVRHLPGGLGAKPAKD